MAVGGILLASVGRGAAVLSGVEPEFIYRNTLLRADALLAGAVGACLARRGLPQWLSLNIRWALPVSLSGVFVIAAASWGTHYHNPWLQALAHPLLWFGFGCFVLECALWPDRWHWVAATPLELFGKYSYGLYVFHWPIAYTMLHYAKEWSLTGWLLAGAMQAIGFVCSCALSWTCYRFLEEPMLRLKRHFTLGQAQASTSYVGLLQLLDERRHDLEKVADDPVVGGFKDGGVRVLVDGNDGL